MKSPATQYAERFNEGRANARLDASVLERFFDVSRLEGGAYGEGYRQGMADVAQAIYCRTLKARKAGIL